MLKTIKEMINGKEYRKSKDIPQEVIDIHEEQKARGLNLEEVAKRMKHIISTYSKWKDDESVSAVKWMNTYIPKVMVVKMPGMDNETLQKYSEFFRYHSVCNLRMQMLSLFDDDNPSFETIDDYMDVEHFIQLLFSSYHDMLDYSCEQNGTTNTLTFKQWKKRFFKKTLKSYRNPYGLERGLNNIQDIEINYIEGMKDYWIKRRDDNQVNRFVAINDIQKH